MIIVSDKTGAAVYATTGTQPLYRALSDAQMFGALLAFTPLLVRASTPRPWDALPVLIHPLALMRPASA